MSQDNQDQSILSISLAGHTIESIGCLPVVGTAASETWQWLNRWENLGGQTVQLQKLWGKGKASVYAGDTIQAANGPQWQTGTVKKGSYFPAHPAQRKHLFVSTVAMARLFKMRDKNDLNVYPMQLHLQNIQSAASTVCCNPTGCIVGAV